jgi:hypothetical protein
MFLYQDSAAGVSGNTQLPLAFYLIMIYGIADLIIKRYFLNDGRLPKQGWS